MRAIAVSRLAEREILFKDALKKVYDPATREKAEEEYLNSISIQPDFPDPFLNLGILYEMYLDRPEEALKNYKEYVRLGGKREDVLVWIEILEKRTGVK